MKLTARLVENFQSIYLRNKFDDPSGVPQLHREMWHLCCSDAPDVAIAAPRHHAKSTSITLTLALAILLFRVRDFMLLVSDTEDQAKKFLHDIKVELQENDQLIADFGIAEFVTDAQTEIEVKFKDGHRFFIICKGSEQRVRGLKWRNKRPNIILVDDFENDESVMNKERRDKTKNWFMNALRPCGAKNRLIRVVGTVLHHDSLLENLLHKDSGWVSKRYRAHKSFSDFSEILWPQRYDAAYFQREQRMAIAAGKEDGYSQEYLNDPNSGERSFFKRAWLKAYEPSEYESRKTYYCAVDFAVSTKQRADRTVFTVASLNQHGTLIVEDVRAGRWDPEEMVSIWFEIDQEYKDLGNPIEVYVVEQGTINKSIGPYLRSEESRRRQYLDLLPIVPDVDKARRARAIQARIKAGLVKFDKDAEWYPALEDELVKFPRGAHDDMVDSLAYMGLLCDRLIQPSTDEELEEEEWAEAERTNVRDGRSPVTGY